MQNRIAETITFISPVNHKNVRSRMAAIGVVCATLMGLFVSAAGVSQASATGVLEAHGGPLAASGAKPVEQTNHTVWQGGEATVTGAIAPGTQLRVYAVLNQACRIGDFTNATCRPQSLLGWEKITEDGIFSPVPAPVAPYGVCRGETVVVVKGHPRVISGQLFECFTLLTTL